MAKPTARQPKATPVLRTKRIVAYRELPTVRLLNRCASDRVPFAWTVNPYRGCEYGCKYCYARYTHEYLEQNTTSDFERKIFVKRWTAETFRRELRQVRAGQWLAIGTATDPYQPVEREYGQTRAVLEVLSTLRGYNVGLTTKSDLVARDAGLLAEVAKHNRVRVTLTVTTLDARLAKTLEPMAPRPDLRMKAVRTLADAGVECGVTVSPVMPGLTDARASLEAVAQAARDAGAKYFMGHVVFLRTSAAAVFLPFVEREFPQLAAAYRKRFAYSAYPRREYVEQIAATIEEIRAQLGLESAVYWQPSMEQTTLDFGAPEAEPKSVISAPAFRILEARAC